MKTFAFVSAAALAAAIAAPAAAQDATGTVEITGSVAPKCIVVPVVGDGDSFSGLVELGELADTDGTLATDLATRFSSVGTGLTAKVVCTTAAPTISVDADPITAASAIADAGYDDSIDFEASVALVTVGTNNGPFTNDSADAAGSAEAVGSRLANSATNVTISASNFRTDLGTDLLVADNYSGQIVVVIAPGA